MSVISVALRVFRHKRWKDESLFSVFSLTPEANIFGTSLVVGLPLNETRRDLGYGKDEDADKDEDGAAGGELNIFNRSPSLLALGGVFTIAFFS